MRSRVFVALLVGWTLGGSATWVNVTYAKGAPQTCEVLLANQTLDCRAIIQPFAEPMTECFEFVAPGVLSQRFDLRLHTPDGFVIPLGCECSPAGSVDKAKFDLSKSFTCGGDTGFGPVATVQGKASQSRSGPKAKGQIGISSGMAGLFECTPRSTPCPASPSGAFIE